MFNYAVGALFLQALYVGAGGVNIVWDRDAPTDFNEVENARSENVRMSNWLFIYPGTKWCGPGNIADGYDDLGDLERTDKCCRAHDFCDDIIEAYQTGHNLTNDKFFTSLNCKCDDEFFKCLKSINSRDSIAVGNIYFNALGQHCFKNEYPIIRCLTYIYFPSRKCIVYDLDETQEKLYQWFDVPVF